MVILSAAVTTKNGRALLSRQFVDMNPLRVEGLLAAFPKLQGTGVERRENHRCLRFMLVATPSARACSISTRACAMACWRRRVC